MPVPADEYVDPYSERLAQLRSRVNASIDAPLPTQMYTPEEQLLKAQSLKRDQVIGQLGAISNHPSIEGFTGPMLKRYHEAQKPKYTEHGAFDETSGKFSYFPGYQESRKLEAYQKMLQAAELASAAGQKQWNSDRQRADEQRALRLTLGAMSAGQDKGSLVYSGSDSETGKPIMMHTKHGPVTQDAQGNLVRYLGPIGPKPGDVAGNVREKIAGTVSNLQGLQQSQAAAEAAAKKGAGDYTTGIIPGMISSFHPAAQAVVTKLRPEEIKDLVSQTAFISDGIRQGRFGMTLTLQEKASAVQYLPSEFDSVEEIQRKAKGLEALLIRDHNNHVRANTRPGMKPFSPLLPEQASPQVSTGAIGSPSSTGVDANNPLLK